MGAGQWLCKYPKNGSENFALPTTCFKLLLVPWNDCSAERSENFAQDVQILLLGAGKGPSKFQILQVVYQTL